MILTGSGRAKLPRCSRVKVKLLLDTHILIWAAGDAVLLTSDDIIAQYPGAIIHINKS
jgi:hypothetical protein